MRRFSIGIVALATVAGLDAAPALGPRGAQELSAVLRQAVARGDVPAVVAMVVGPNDVLYHEAFGKLNVAANVDLPKDAIFNIASMTKPITSVAVMMLVEQGRLALDDELARYDPAWRSPQVIVSVDAAAGTYRTRPAARPITIRHLLTHTSGIGYIFFNPTLAAVSKAAGRTNELELPLVHDPGERWTYGASTRVLGQVVEKISGQPIDEFLRSRIFEPLGMRDTGYVVPAGGRRRVVTTHQRGADGALHEQPLPDTVQSPVRGDGGLYSTAADYGRFLQMLLHGGRSGRTRLLGERWVREMTRPHTGRIVVETQQPTDPARSRPFPLGAGADRWGLGFQITAPASTSSALRRPGSYAWAGAFNTHFWVDPEEEIGVILLMQLLPFYDERAMGLVKAFEEGLYRNLE
ncbi:MAG TPA: serine hydrolase domain-containing protein [Vicinamibacterales bacterium]|nr:serine hydrolase domain-containing protein [Vicinamibacterales bacterium]